MTWLPNAQKNLSADAQSAFLLPLRDTVILPSVTLPVIAGRPRSAASVEAAIEHKDQQIAIASLRPETLERLDQNREADVEDVNDLYPIATLAIIRQVTRLPVGLIQLIVEGTERIQLQHLSIAEDVFKVTFDRLPPLTVEAAVKAGSEAVTLRVLTDAIKQLWSEMGEIDPQFPDEILTILFEETEAVQLAYRSIILMQEKLLDLQASLAENDLEKLLRQVVDSLQKHVEEAKLRSQILSETQREINEQQQAFFLRQQLKTIQEKLGEGDPDKAEISELEQRLSKTVLPPAAQKQTQREIARLERVGSASAEGGVIRTYLDWLLEMPWKNRVEDDLDLQNARAILDADHYGLDKVKDRIIEHLATFKLRLQAHRQAAVDEDPSEANEARFSVGTAICFVGPPGVGKTSLGRSIARTLGRPFERISLGGLRDEAELRGHRRTYIGAMPGRIVQAIHRAGVKNPVIILDELDKVGMDYRGDPASVLLEILDPQQNYCFHDLYLDLEFDLSQVIFIGTANDLSKVPPPLLDRLELIELSGYSDLEKQAIARHYLLPRQLENAGLPAEALQLPEDTLRRIIDDYTREAGVRRLEQQLGSLCRKVAVKFANGETHSVSLHPEQLETLLGPEKYRREERRSHAQPGVATGLAWTLAGGEVLFVEAVLLPESKELTLTGQLGEVMEESVRIARSYIWAHAKALGIDLTLLKDSGLHLHVPAGAIPKDGPSAGVTMLAAMASLLLNQPVRTDTAMTGEIDLSGDVMSVGGIREKVLAAHRAGIYRVLLPKQNEKDLVDVPDRVREQMTFVGCDRVEQVLQNALFGDSQVPHNSGHSQPSLSANGRSVSHNFLTVFPYAHRHIHL